MPNIGPLELVIVLVILLVIFGPKRLPGLGKQLGDGMRDFKDALSRDNDDDEDKDKDVAPPALAASPATPDSGSVDVPAPAPAVPAVPATPAERTGQDT